MYSVYVLKSLKDNKLYIGVSENPDRRLKEHNAGKNKSTRYRRPFELVYVRHFQDKDTAYKYEWYVKNTGEGNINLKKIIQAKLAKVVTARV